MQRDSASRLEELEMMANHVSPPRGVSVWRDRRGGSSVEWLLLVGVVACVALVGFAKFGGVTSAKAECLGVRLGFMSGTANCKGPDRSEGWGPRGAAIAAFTPAPANTAGS